MKVDGIATRTIWPADDGKTVEIIDQTLLPHRFEVARLRTVEDAAQAISTMRVRGAPLIGAAAAYGLALAMEDDPSDAGLAAAHDRLLATRPTAVNLRWALAEMRTALTPVAANRRALAAWMRANEIADADVEINRAIGEHGFALLKAIFEEKGRPAHLNVLTHCNAGWLATVDWGTALAPVYAAFDAGLPLHVWVDETRPRNQGASLTAWELVHHGVPHTVIADNTGGHLMQHGMVDACIVGTDRTTATGDVCNKIGTYLKALAARDNGVPFFVGLPGPTIDWTLSDGVAQIPIEQRSPREQSHISGLTADGRVETVRLVPEGSVCANYGFDVTPARLITALITERGACPASREGLAALYPEHAAK
jgi:methylthioribose-1-phosphate isomerase